jgi:hypothetical protein
MMFIHRAQLVCALDDSFGRVLSLLFLKPPKVLEHDVEARFHDSSFGFRRLRGAGGAPARAAPARRGDPVGGAEPLSG